LTPRFVFSVVAASTGAILGACGGMVLHSTSDASADDLTDDVTEDVQSFAPGSPTVTGCSCGGSAGGGFDLPGVSYDATNDAIENLDTGPDHEVEASDDSGHAASDDSGHEASNDSGHGAVEAGDP
jgi:hypothetical protein